MNSSLDKNINSDSLLSPHSLDLNNIPYNKYKSKQKISKKININNRLYDHQRKKGNFKYIEKYVHKYFLNFYRNTKNDYNVRMIEDILNNESTHLVAEFKDYLIMGDITEFLQKSYNIQECKKYLPKIYEYYNSCSVIFPNYVTLHESKYIYKSIRKKQKVIDNQQEQEEKQEKIKKGDIKLDDNEEFFSSKTFYSILDQTNTSNVKYFFGINDNNNIDANETPNNIVEKLEQAEKDALQKKISLVKNIKTSIVDINNSNNNNNNNNNNLNDNSNIHKNNNSFYNNIINNSKIYIKNKILKERNKNKGNIQYFNTQKKTEIKNNNSNMNINNINLNQQNSNKITINSYVSKKSIKNENDYSKKHIKSSISINDTENDNSNKAYNNYITFYGNNFNNSKRKETRKLFIESSGNKPHQIYIRNGSNHSNKNIKNQYVNSKFPTKNIISTIFTNVNNNNSILKQNSFNFINKKMANKKNKEENQNQYNNSPIFPLSPSSITIQANPFRKKYNYNLNLNIKESNSSRNIINNNHKLNDNINNIDNKINEKINLKNIEKIKRNEKKHNNLNYNSNTIAATIISKTTTNKDKIKYIHTNKNFNFNKAQLKNNNHKKYNNLNNINNINNINNFRTIINSSRSNANIYNTNNNNNNIDNIYYKNNNNYNNINFNNNNTNYINNIVIKDLNIHKINSTSNIKKPINMNININMNNNSKNKIYFNEGSCGNIIDNKIYSKSPLSIELETIKVTTKKRTIYPKQKKLEKREHIIFNNNYNTNNIINSINNNTLSNDKNYYLNSLGYSSLNSNNQNDEINNGIKTGLILEEINKKKNLVFPFNKEINNINININGYNAHGGSLTSRASKNSSKNKYKKNMIAQVQDIPYYNKEFKMKPKNKNIKKNNINNNFISKNDNNPVKIKGVYDNIKNNNNDNQKLPGYITSRKNK